MKMKFRVIYLLLFVAVLCVSFTGSSVASDAKIKPQQSLIASLERQVAAGEKEIASLRESRAANEAKVRSLARQVETRNRLLTEQRKNEVLLRDEIKETQSSLTELSAKLVDERSHYSAMVREAYRNYKNQNMLIYLFSASDFQDMALKVANMRAVGKLREQRIVRIDSLSTELQLQQQILSGRKAEHEEAIAKLTSQKNSLQRDVNSARKNISAMSAKERKTLQQRELKQKQLDAAVKELQKLIKGNKEGASFSSKTSNLNLPVVGGRVKQYRENMSEVVGAKGAKVISIYDGKVVDVRQNRITGKHDVYIAHGEYITSYAGLYSVSVAKDQSVKKGSAIGVIGEAVDIITMQSEHKIVFGIYSPNPKENIKASSCFKR